MIKGVTSELILIQDQFGIIQNLQMSPIPQTNLLVVTFFGYSYSKTALEQQYYIHVFARHWYISRLRLRRHYRLLAYLFLQKPCRIKQKWIILGFKYDLNDPLVLLVHIKSKQDLEKQSFAK